MTNPEGGQSATDPTGQSAGGSTGTGTAGDPGQSAGGTGTGTDPNAAAGAGQSADLVQRAEYEALRARLAAADKRAADNEAALKQIRDKDMPAIEKMTRDLAERDAQLAQQTTELNAKRIENAFLTDNTHKWRNPATAMRLLDQSKILVDSDGTVSGMKDALAALAKSDEYLLAPVEGDGGGDGKPPATPPLGTPPANGGTGTGASSASAMQKRFPALRTRIG